MPENAQHSDLLNDLTEPQREAVTHVDGPLLVLAGAGSGKTRVVTRRIAHLILEIGIPPWNVLAITFTNKASGEMRERVGQLVSAKQASAVTVCTFHSLCSRILRMHGQRLNLPPGFSIYDSQDQQKAMKLTLEAMDISTTNFPPAKVLHTISSAKNQLIGPAAYETSVHDFYGRTIAKIYHKYEARLRQNNAVDFDDLLLLTVELMRNHPIVLQQLRERYQYLLIDEYQDTNHAQFILAHALASEHKNICATGDPDQSIYGWRGANLGNILDFEEHYPNATVVRLEQNYRSTKSILAAADGLIRNNKRRKHKSLWTENEQGAPISIIRCHDERAEAGRVVDLFREKHIQEGIPWSGFAVFYRTNSLSRVMEDALRTASIPYQIARGTSFYERKEIKDAVAYFRAIANPADEVNLTRIVNLPPRGISLNSVKAIQAHAVATSQSFASALNEPSQVASLNTRAVKSVGTFAALLDQWRSFKGEEISLRSLVERVLRESGLEDHYRKDTSDVEGDRIENLGELVSFAQQFEQDLEGEFEYVEGNLTPRDNTPLYEKLNLWLEQISLVSDVDGVKEGEGAVTLMTLHAAKGLEYPMVAMIGLEDGMLPHQRSLEDGRDIEEERRLCFVGITRARRFLAMTYVKFRTVFGQTMPTIPSRFLDELPSDSVEREDSDSSDDFQERLSAEVTIQRESAKQQAMAYPPGTLVRHPQFGLGRIIQISATGAQTRARVEFNTSGVKTLILQFARLEVVEY